MSKEIELENGLKIQININANIASIIESKKVTGDVLVPQKVLYEGKQIKITTIKRFAFRGARFDSLIFQEDSEVETFESNIFDDAFLKKLQIPPKLKNIDKSCFCNAGGIIDFDVSPKNKKYFYLENKYFVGKSDESNDTFDILFYSRYDIENAIIPPQIKIISDHAFWNHEQLNSVIFPDNSKLKRIESGAFLRSNLSKINLPATLEYISTDAFTCTIFLTKIEISNKNERYKMMDDTFLVGKIENSSDSFESIIICRKNVDSIRIPSHIKKINEAAFQCCVKLGNVTFEPISSLEKIGGFGFYSCVTLKTIIIPPKVESVGSGCFGKCWALETIDFLGQKLYIGSYCFEDSIALKSVSFLNATRIEFGTLALCDLREEAVLNIRKGAEQIGVEPSVQKQIRIIEPSPARRYAASIHPPSANKEVNNENKNENIDVSKCMRRIRFLENRLSRYEEVKPFDPDESTSEQESDAFIDEIEHDLAEDEKGEKIFFDKEDESHHRVVSQIGEGATSFVYKVIDERTEEEMCKKVLKTDENTTTFKDFRNIYKEFEVLYWISHPCICKCIGMNPQEEVETPENEAETDDDYGIDYIEIKKNKKPNSSEEELAKKTTIAIFLKFHPMNLRQCLENDILNNTLKAKLAVEIAFGLIHRDLKLENVMVNYIFEAQLINFGLAHINEMKSTMSTLSKGVGTFAYMSPEMQNEEEYDSKTDVYSFGVLLFVLLTRRLPKQSLKDKLNKGEVKMPPPSDTISSFSISLIKKCMAFEPSKRPTFDQIIEDMFSNSFKLASGVDEELVARRYRYLNCYRAFQQRSQFNSVKMPSTSIHSRRSIQKPIIKKPIGSTKV